MKHRYSLTASLLLVAMATSAHAQEGVTKVPMSSRYSFGADFMIADPRGEFKNNAKAGFGFGGHALMSADQWGIAGMRIDLGMVRYGDETHRYSCGTLCTYDATTSNDIINLQVGAQLMMPRKAILPYIGASYGTLLFTTNSRVKTRDGSQSPFRHNVQEDDFTGSFMIGGGLYIPMTGALGGFTANIGARLFTGGEAEYLSAKSLQCNSTGCTVQPPFKSRTDFVVYHVGVSSSMGVRK